MSKEKMPLLIGGGVLGIVLIGLLVFVGIKALGGDDEPTTNPGTGDPQPTNGTSQAPGGGNGQLGEASGQAKTATEKLQGQGFGCADLFNTGQGAHRGCFRNDQNGNVEAVFQFLPDGTVTGVRIDAQNNDNVNNAKVIFDQALQALGNDTFGGSEVKKIQDAVTTGQSREKIGTSWGEFNLNNSGRNLDLSGRKSGADNLDLPRKTLSTTAAQLQAGIKTKGYACRETSCQKKLGKYGSITISGSGSQGAGLSSLRISGIGSPDEVKDGVPAAIKDTFAAVKGPDADALKKYFEANLDGKSHAAYVAGFRVEIDANLDSSSFGSMSIMVSNEYFYV